MPRSHRQFRVLLMADSHLGFDLPVRPRIQRRRRGHDFQANHDMALASAKTLGVDLVIHGGDLFHRPGALPSLAYQAFRGLLEVADSGVPVFVVPGNHERSRIPHLHLAAHPDLYVFERPGTVCVQAKGVRVAVAGFPYRRRNVREAFPEIVRQTGCATGAANGDVNVVVNGNVNEDLDGDPDAVLRLLCMHHCVEGATVGPADYTFRNAADVVRCAELPGTVAAVLSGHIHRPQILTRDLRGRPLPAPVIYPGSVERTAFAEAGEDKGFFVLDFRPGPDGGELIRHEFVRLPARPMVVVDLRPGGVDGGNGRSRVLDAADDDPLNGADLSGRGYPGTWSAALLRQRISGAVAATPKDGIVRVRVHGMVPSDARRAVSAAWLRRMAPAEMNLEAMVMEDRGSSRGVRRSVV